MGYIQWRSCVIIQRWYRHLKNIEQPRETYWVPDSDTDSYSSFELPSSDGYSGYDSGFDSE